MPRNLVTLRRTPENAAAYDHFINLAVELADKYGILEKRKRRRPPDEPPTTNP